MNGVDRSLRIVLLLVHEVAFYSRYTLLTEIASFLVAAAVAGLYGNATGSLLLPFLAARSAFPGTLNGGLGGCGSAIISGCFHVPYEEGGTNRILTIGVSSCDVE
jgi:hypothetical protein